MIPLRDFVGGFRRGANNMTILTLNLKGSAVPSILLMTKADICRHAYFDLPCTDLLKNRYGNVILRNLIIS